MIPDYCRDCSFDGAILGRPVWQLLDSRHAAHAIEAAKADGVGLVTYRGLASLAQDIEPAGFRPVEVLVRYQKSLAGVSHAMPTGTRIAGAGDADAVSAIAACAFQHDRWHSDPEIPNHIADALKAAWARNNVLGRAAPVFVAEQKNGRIAGFNAVLVKGDTAIIDLIAIEQSCRGRGMGRRLIDAVWLLPVKAVQVGTQAKNTASIRLYESAGFTEIQRLNTWHWTP